MAGRSSHWKTALILMACGVLVATSGCRRRPARVQENPAETAPIVEEAPVEPVPDPAPPEAPPEPEPEPVPPPPLEITVLLSDDLPQYTSVRTALERSAHVRLTVHSLAGEPSRVEPLQEQLRVEAPENVVSIGLLAARATRDLQTPKTVFCQVFNYQDHGLLDLRAQGIETIPDPWPAVEAWARLDDGLKRIGLITGAGQEDRIERARESLARHGVELVHRITRSDKETLLEFQRLISEIDGYWMFPDNRVLSSSTIREMMSLARRSRIGVMANDPGFHQIGALICASNDPSEIAQSAVEILDSARDDEILRGDRMRPLRHSAITIREDVAIQLGYDAGGIEPDMLVR